MEVTDTAEETDIQPGGIEVAEEVSNTQEVCVSHWERRRETKIEDIQSELDVLPSTFGSEEVMQSAENRQRVSKKSNNLNWYITDYYTKKNAFLEIWQSIPASINTEREVSYHWCHIINRTYYGI